MTTPRHLHMIGHGHIDPTWLWRWTEGYEEVRATFRAALDRMNETPDFTFTASSACFYAWIKSCDPVMFEEIKQRVAEGRWELAGGWWIEPDCNIPNGESLIRQGLYGQRFFQSELGKPAVIGFNPDSFGHAGTLPQILHGMGIDHYMYMRPMPNTEMKYPEGTTFRWRAPDGTQVLTTCLLISYTATGDELPNHIKGNAESPDLNRDQTEVVCFYGVGNHGGGPTKEAIKIINAYDGPHSLTLSTLEAYFNAVAEDLGEAIPRIESDLQSHARGCYSVHSEIKSLNRKCEHALMTAERWASAGRLVLGRDYPAAPLEGAWKDLLYNQFHDILAGTSLESSYEDARDQLGRARQTASEIINESLQTLARAIDTTAEGNTVVVFNPCAWPVTTTVAAPPIAARTLELPLHLVDDTDAAVPMQPVLGERIDHTAHAFTAQIPALGYRCYHMRSGAATPERPGALEISRTHVENDWWRIEFDPYDGYISRLYDKKAEVEVLSKGNVLVALVDPSDTWSHRVEEWRVEAGRFAQARLEVLEKGPVRATVRIVSRFGNSVADQTVTLHRAHPTIDCQFRINWQERYTMLKVAYETNLVNGVSTCDTAYGRQIRNTKGTEEPCQKWIDLTGTPVAERGFQHTQGGVPCQGGTAIVTDGDTPPYGLAILNDSKYGYDARNSDIRLTLLRSPAYAYHDPARHDASEPWPIMDQGWHRVHLRLLPHAGSWESVATPRKAFELNELPVAHCESAHLGNLPLQGSFLECPAQNVVLGTLKESEDGKGLIVRGYEAHGVTTETTLNFPSAKKTIPVTFTPHQIKSFRINPDAWTLEEVNLLEET